METYPEKDWSFYNKDHLKNRPKQNPNRLSYADIMDQRGMDMHRNGENYYARYDHRYRNHK